MIQLELLSGLLDAVDGHAARLLGQSSKFGAMLDMLTDRWQFKVVPLASSYIRCATMCLLTTLSTFYPSFMFLFQVKCLVSFQYLIELFLLNAADHFDFSCQWQLTLPATGSTSTPLCCRWRKTSSRSSMKSEMLIKTPRKSSSCYPSSNPSYPGSNQPQVCWSHWQLLDAPLLHWQADILAT